MKKFASRLRHAFAVSIASASILATAATASAADLKVWEWAPDFNGASMAAAKEAYAKIKPEVKINVIDMHQTALQQALQTQLASGVTTDLPDIVLIDDYSAQKYLQAFPGAFEPLDGKIDYTQFAPYKVAVSTVGDHSYSLPFDSGAAVLFYRTDLLAEAGFSPDDMQNITWERYIEIGKTVEAKTGHKMTSQDLADPAIINMMLQSAGSWYFTPEGKINVLDNPVFKAALSTHQKYLQSGIYKPTSGWNNFTGAFVSGEVASVNGAAWMVGMIKGNKTLAGKWGVAPLPRLSDVEGATNYSNQGGSSWYVLASSPNKDVAIDFLNKIWANDLNFYQKILVEVGAIGSWMPARKGPAYRSSDDFFSGQPVWANISDWVTKIPAVNYGLFSEEAANAVRAQLPSLLKGGNVDDIAAAIEAQLRQQIQ